VIAIGALLVLGLIVFGMLRGRQRRQEIAERRDQAQELRREADARTQQAEERTRVAEEQARQARDGHKAAAEVGARADRIDPDVETPEE